MSCRKWILLRSSGESFRTLLDHGRSRVASRLSRLICGLKKSRFGRGLLKIGDPSFQIRSRARLSRRARRRFWKYTGLSNRPQHGYQTISAGCEFLGFGAEEAVDVEERRNGCRLQFSGSHEIYLHRHCARGVEFVFESDANNE
jgi:hypothetical protein